MNVTAETVTDEQIRDLLAAARDGYPGPGMQHRELMRDCIAALSTTEIVVARRCKTEARSRVAAAINARTKR